MSVLLYGRDAVQYCKIFGNVYIYVYISEGSRTNILIILWLIGKAGGYGWRVKRAWDHSFTTAMAVVKQWCLI